MSYFVKWSVCLCRKCRVLTNGLSVSFGDVVYGWSHTQFLMPNGQGNGHVGSLRALNEVFYQIITLLPTVNRRSVTANIATLPSFSRRSYGCKVFGDLKRVIDQFCLYSYHI